MPFVDLWLGRAESKTALDSFLAETYGDNDEPISAFAASQGEWFYDHDFLEVNFDPSFESMTDALRGISFSASYAEEVLARVPGSIDANFSIAYFDEELMEAPCDATSEGISLTYAGRFACDFDAEIYT